MKFVVVSGLSGSGKSSALHLLEDEGYICIDNLPVNMLPELIRQFQSDSQKHQKRLAIGIDARNINSDLSQVQSVIEKVKNEDDTFNVIYLHTNLQILLKRYSETRRRHPLSDENTNVSQAIAKETQILQPIISIADKVIDTSELSLHQLRSLVKKSIVGKETKGTTILLTSFGFKFGLPVDADIVFDVRCLPNPHWHAELRPYTGKDEPVIEFLKSDDKVISMINDIYQFVEKWVPSYEENNRSYLTIAIGCTGGQHRSVFICEQLAQKVKQIKSDVQIKHHQLHSK